MRLVTHVIGVLSPPKGFARLVEMIILETTPFLLTALQSVFSSWYRIWFWLPTVYDHGIQYKQLAHAQYLPLCSISVTSH